MKSKMLHAGWCTMTHSCSLGGQLKVCMQNPVTLCEMNPSFVWWKTRRWQQSLLVLHQAICPALYVLLCVCQYGFNVCIKHIIMEYLNLSFSKCAAFLFLCVCLTVDCEDLFLNRLLWDSSALIQILQPPHWSFNCVAHLRRFHG